MHIPEKNIMGAVLCGGKSIRMGTDKGLLKQNATTWAELAANKLAVLNLEVVISVNEQQADLYSRIFDAFPVIKDDNALEVFGPLKGILSIHLHYSNNDLLVLACDMPAMKTEAIEYMVKLSSEKKEEAFVFKNEECFEPLCAIYTSAGLRKIYDLYKKGQLLKYSLHHVIEVLNTFYIVIPQEWKYFFNNYNAPEDLTNSTGVII